VQLATIGEAASTSRFARSAARTPWRCRWRRHPRDALSV